MTAPLLVGVLGSRIGSRVAATIGYGNRELDLYPTDCIEPMHDAGMLPVGVASADVSSGLDWSDLLSALVVPHDSRGGAGADCHAGGRHGHTGLPIVIDALAAHLPVLAIGTGECLLTAALAEHAAELSTSAMPDDPDLARLLGVSGGRQLPMVVSTAGVPSGMRAVASAGDGSVCAVATDDGPVGPALSVRWDPGRLPPGDQARDGPFRWLRDHAASPRAWARSARQAHPTEREEVQ